jgi:hypothetical protein
MQNAEISGNARAEASGMHATLNQKLKYKSTTIMDIALRMQHLVDFAGFNS